MSDDDVPRFDLERPYYDQSTYYGRVRHFINIINPMTLMVGQEELELRLKMLKDFEAGVSKASNSELWKSRETKEAIVHPDTGESIWAPFRMSAFVPLNIPLCVGMISASTVPSTIFWQWMNQTYNVCVNYANRNASNELSYEQVGKAYVGAVTSSCAIAVGLRHAFRNASSPILRAMVPYVAVASAGAINVGLMRFNEMIDGIEVRNDDGEVLGTSVAAGRSAVAQVALTRIVLPAPILVLPRIITGMMSKVNLMPASHRGKLLVEVGVVTCCLFAGLPFAIGLFPQESRIDVSELEPQFQNLTDSQGRPITSLTFNKGL